MRTARGGVRELTKTLDSGSYGLQYPLCFDSRTRLGKPLFDVVEVSQCLVGIQYVTWQRRVELSVGVWHWQLTVRANAVNPSLHLGRIYEPAGCNVGLRLCNPLSLPIQPMPPLSFCLHL